MDHLGLDLPELSIIVFWAFKQWCVIIGLFSLTL